MPASKPPETADWKTQVAYQFSKAGPWALLSLFLLGGISFGLYKVGSHLGPILTEWVSATRDLEEQNAKNVASLTAAQSEATREHITMLQTLDQLGTNQTEITKTFVSTLQQATEERLALIASGKTLQDALTARATEHSNQCDQLEQIVTLIGQANTLMSRVPAQRDEELELLGHIRDSMDDLIVEIKKLTPPEAAEEAPNSPP